MKIIADSINSITGLRLTTFLIQIPTCLLAELRTHRLLRWSDTDFSINANSDRAIPIEKKINMIKENPYIPIVTLKNKGMSGIEENIDNNTIQEANILYKKAMLYNINIVKKLDKLGIHKQYANRLLAPFSYSNVIITGDEIAFKHFFKLRTDKSAEPNIRKIAIEMKEMFNKNLYDHNINILNENEWHIAFDNEINKSIKGIDRLLVSASMCAKISYNTQNNNDTIEKHIERARTCYKNGHYSIFEHQARIMTNKELVEDAYISNVKHWILFRKLLELGDFKL